MLKIIDSENLSARDIMERDEKMLKEIDPIGSPILHFYRWSLPSITCGYFIDPKKYLNMENIQKRNIDLARRPTGGGIVFHLWDMAFSFLLPSGNRKFSSNTLENYFFVNSAVLKAVKNFLKSKMILSETKKKSKNEVFEPFGGFQKLDFFNNESMEIESLYKTGFCMASPTKYDVMMGGKKVAGAAQRRTKNGYLHQGSISFVMPDMKILYELLIDKKLCLQIQSNTFALLKEDEKTLDVQKTAFRSFLISYLQKSLF